MSQVWSDNGPLEADNKGSNSWGEGGVQVATSNGTSRPSVWCRNAGLVEFEYGRVDDVALEVG